MEQFVRASKFLSLILRHKPEAGGITLDPNGWAATNSVLGALGRQGYSDKLEDLDTIVNTDNKKRYIYSEDKSKIRANQGHSVEVDLELSPQQPPEKLYHGTAQKSVQSILAGGLNAGSRQFVHLSTDIDTATNVGSRHGKPQILVIDAYAMHKAGRKFYLARNGVWLTKEVPVKYLQPL